MARIIFFVSFNQNKRLLKMKRILFCTCILVLIPCFASKGLSFPDTVALQNDYPIKPIPFTSIQLADSFWLPKIDRIHSVTIPHALTQSANRLMNFKIAAGLETGSFQSSYPFDDSDIYKIIEAASYSLYYNPDTSLEAEIDSIISIIGLAQEPDGYLYTCRTMNSFPNNWSGNSRWVNEEELSHETYNLGHLFEAACAYYQATGKDNLLKIAVKAADLLDSTFGWGKLEEYPGHQIVEVGLSRLYRITGDKRYLDLAKFFLDVRGPGGDEYNQAQAKVVDQTTAVGHAVRAVYMYSGMADIAALFNDSSYIRAIDKIWEDIVTKKIYVTGGIGASGGNEGFSGEYNLPNSSAYCETCASVGNIYFNHRLFLLHGDAKYIDILERTLYNALLSGISLSGNRFFYSNPLSSAGSGRSVWFECACCPPNIARLIPSVPGYIYAQKQDTLYLNLFMSDTATFAFNNDTLQIIQSTGYPWDSTVNIKLNRVTESAFTLMVRIPGWARNEPVYGDLYQFADTINNTAIITINGENYNYNLDKGYAVITHSWKAGDHVVLNLPAEPRKIIANEKVSDDKDKFTVQRGPLVFCVEGVDNAGNISALKYSRAAVLTSGYDPSLLGGTQVVKLHAAKTDGSEGSEVTLIPYSMWANREISPMQVWLSYFRTYPDSLILVSENDFATTNYVSPWENLNSIYDLYDPSSSYDKGDGAFGNWMSDGRTVGQWNWVQYNFAESKHIHSSEVYWWRDGQGINLPDSSYLSYYDESGKANVKLSNTVKGGSQIIANQYNYVIFPAVTTKAIRLNFYGKTMAQGILEWKVYRPDLITGLSANEATGRDVKIFPNPTDDLITIELNTSQQAEVFVYDLTGKLCYKKSFANHTTLSKSNIGSNGVYIFRIITDEIAESRRIVIT
jgi:DUF1680 family protein